MKTSFVVLLLLPFALEAQDSTRIANAGFVSVETDPRGAEIFLDSVRIGTSPIERWMASPGIHALQVFFPSAAAWNAFVKREEVRVVAGSEVRISHEFGSLLSIRSLPSGATVTYEGKDLGVTPLIFKSETLLRGSLLLQKEQFSPLSVGLGDSSLGVFRLKPLAGIIEPNEVSLEERGESGSRKWATYGSATGMVASGILAAYFKDQANKKFNLYLSTKNDSYLSSTRRLDRQSAIALVITELSFAALSYLLISE